MNEELVLFETAIAAKDKGFNEKCSDYFVRQWGKSFIELHGKSFKREVKDDQGEVIGFYRAGNSEGQPHLIARPTQSLLQKWLREVHKIVVYSAMDLNGTDSEIRYFFAIQLSNLTDDKYHSSRHGYSSYEEALEAGLQEALKLIP